MGRPKQAETAAWQALRRTRRGLGAHQGKPVATGFSPALAAAELAAWGMDSQQAAAAVRAALLRRFPAFAASWSAYLAEKGWGLELAAMGPAEQAAFEEGFALHGAAQLFAELRRDPLQALGNVPELIALTAQLNDLQAAGDPARHPAFYFMTRIHGLDPQLAKAVLLHSREAPSWAILAGIIIGLTTGFVAVLAFLDPQNAIFTSDGGRGAGLLQRILLPLVSLAALGLTGYLAWDRPRRRKAWTEQLRSYAGGSGRMNGLK